MFQESDRSTEATATTSSICVPTLPTKWTPLISGKYQGKTLPQLVVKDPDHFFWMRDNKALGPYYAEELAYVDYCARRISVPDHPTYGKSCVHYFVRNDVLVNVELRPFNDPEHRGSSYSVRSAVLDLSFARSLKTYDKTGGRLLTTFLRDEVLGVKSLAKKRCHAFFKDGANFE